MAKKQVSLKPLIDSMYILLANLLVIGVDLGATRLHICMHLSDQIVVHSQLIVSGNDTRLKIDRESRESIGRLIAISNEFMI